MYSIGILSVESTVFVICDRDTNVMDTLMDRMAKYAEKLQSAVEERAAEVTKEKRRCDELLSKMLPR